MTCLIFDQGSLCHTHLAFAQLPGPAEDLSDRRGKWGSSASNSVDRAPTSWRQSHKRTIPRYLHFSVFLLLSIFRCCIWKIYRFFLYYLLVTEKLADFLGASRSNPDYLPASDPRPLRQLAGSSAVCSGRIFLRSTVGFFLRFSLVFSVPYNYKDVLGQGGT